MSAAHAQTPGGSGGGPDETILVSRPSGSGALANGDSFHTTISGNGNRVTFMSTGDNLVPGDNNNQFDIFVRDVSSATTTIVSRSAGFGPPNSDGRSSWPAISADGRYVAFQSFADNLVRGDINRKADIFVRDLKAGTTRLVSRPSRGRALGDGNSLDPAISAHGRFVAYQSFADNLVARDTNRRADVFVTDLKTGRTRLVSGPGRRPRVSADGEADNPALSASGRYVAFESTAGNLTPGDHNHVEDVYLHDVRTGRTHLVSRSRRSGSSSGDGPSYMASVSADGHLVAFASRATNLVPDDTDRAEDVFVWNLRTGRTQLASVRTHGGAAPTAPSNRTIYPSLSASGRYLAFHSDANDIVPGDSNAIGDVFVRDLRTGTTRLVSRPNGSQTEAANNYSGGPLIAADGRYVAFASFADNLVVGDTNQVADIFRRRVR